MPYTGKPSLSTGSLSQALIVLPVSSEARIASASRLDRFILSAILPTFDTFHDIQFDFLP